MATLKYKTPEGEWKKVSIGGGGSTVEVVDNLESESTTAALSAKQGRVLNEGKQDALVSGTNIKTINNQSILGSGNITIEGGGGGGGLETRILYVPQLTAEGSELTAEEKAYNLETANKMLAGTARAAISISGMINLTTTNAMNMSMFKGEGTLIVFDYDFVPVNLGFIIGTDGDILLNFPTSTIFIAEEELSNTDFTAIGMCLYYRYACGNPPSIYLAESKEDTIIPCSSISVLGEDAYILEFIYYSSGHKHIATLAVYEENVENATAIFPNRVYVSTVSSSLLEANRNWWKTYASSYANKTPSVVYSDSYSYSPLCVNRGNEYADFTIYRDNALEVWRILASDGTASLISTSQLQFVTTE